MFHINSNRRLAFVCLLCRLSLSIYHSVFCHLTIMKIYKIKLLQYYKDTLDNHIWTTIHDNNEDLQPSAELDTRKPVVYPEWCVFWLEQWGKTYTGQVCNASNPEVEHKLAAERHICYKCICLKQNTCCVIKINRWSCWLHKKHKKKPLQFKLKILTAKSYERLFMKRSLWSCLVNKQIFSVTHKNTFCLSFRLS